MLCNVPAFKLIVLLTVRSAEVEEKKAWQKNKTKLDIEWKIKRVRNALLYIADNNFGRTK